MKIVGLTGGIGSGKSTVLNEFKDLGIKTYSADNAAKTLINSDRALIDSIKKVFGNKKDSWNTADVFVVNAQKEGQILKRVKELQSDFQNFVAPEIFVGTLNAYLSQLVKDNDLIPLSLKKQTKNAPVKVKETNVDDVPVEGLIPFDGLL